MPDFLLFSVKFWSLRNYGISCMHNVFWKKHDINIRFSDLTQVEMVSLVGALPLFSYFIKKGLRYISHKRTWDKKIEWEDSFTWSVLYGQTCIFYCLICALLPIQESHLFPGTKFEIRQKVALFLSLFFSLGWEATKLTLSWRNKSC